MKVTSLGQTFTAQGQGYGPFTATAERPYLEVPLSIALVSGAPVYEEDEVAAPAGQTDQEELAGLRDLAKRTADAVLERAAFLTVPRFDDQHPGGMDVAQAVAAGLDDLKRQLDQVQAEYGTFKDAANRAGAEGTNARVALERQVTELQGELAITRARITELEGAPVPDQTPASERASDLAPTPTGTPLVDGLPSPELLTANGFDTMEALAAGLVVPDGATESPVMAVTGIGKKSVEAYQKAVTDWAAERA
ncbi:hypothetical protein [uncultured Deinococcus sp.]|uniref:hypothetical protein n=1 Tax=uncultured Deinococcus sp. TaxID=158789 RepID=UPI0025DB8AB7|nr:hypothetical protein [uncultured Deinococcus sp.]